MADIESSSPTFPLAEMTTRIVAAYLSRTEIGPDDLSKVISRVADGLRAIEGRSEADDAANAPIVPVDQSVTRNYVTCLLCGKKHKTLKRHLAAAHNLTPQEYRERFSLPAHHPLVAPAHSKRRSDIAHEIRLGGRRRPVSVLARAALGE